MNTIDLSKGIGVIAVLCFSRDQTIRNSWPFPLEKVPPKGAPTRGHRARQKRLPRKNKSLHHDFCQNFSVLAVLFILKKAHDKQAWCFNPTIMNSRRRQGDPSETLGARER